MEVTHTKTGRTDQFQFPLPDSKVKPFYDNATGLRHEAEAVRQAINDGKTLIPRVLSFYTNSFICVNFSFSWPRKMFAIYDDRFDCEAVSQTLFKNPKTKN